MFTAKDRQASGLAGRAPIDTTAEEVFLDLGEMAPAPGNYVWPPHLEAMVTRQNDPKHLEPILSYENDRFGLMKEIFSAQDLRLGEISTVTSKNTIG